MLEPTTDIGNVLLRLAASILLAAVYGWEREYRDKPAGLKTHMLLALGSAALTIIAVQFPLTQHQEQPGIEFDPFRLIQGILTGIGFLGAGTIIQSNGDVEGLTTAATLWMVTAIGVACGLGYLTIAAMTTGLGLAVLIAVKSFERRLFSDQDSDES
ncbi:MgtC/SapB family protein [Thalassoroseus pseudoceratinae]|uniref:MgtC/SapB family protein n=1 Tax=Thalassoroseus pseudoceratinae TaxID=2713176 RepID=UPI00141DFB1F|nr:MgtC/SapB family protein [Thalassoroseus pseudoceratinae]